MTDFDELTREGKQRTSSNENICKPRASRNQIFKGKQLVVFLKYCTDNLVIVKYVYHIIGIDTFENMYYGRSDVKYIFNNVE